MYKNYVFLKIFIISGQISTTSFFIWITSVVLLVFHRNCAELAGFVEKKLKKWFANSENQGHVLRKVTLANHVSKS